MFTCDNNLLYIQKKHEEEIAKIIRIDIFIQHNNTFQFSDNGQDFP